ncbi:Lipoamide acyltransferase component of branched-chain alpha-keto acid dehydrogenase complex [Dirofilaria immitis]|nr:Lipoamide acyltransferase component of branched-chain alpha-keto acid dehydrogenase complex [Dirofilaria immitis]
MTEGERKKLGDDSGARILMHCLHDNKIFHCVQFKCLYLKPLTTGTMRQFAWTHLRYSLKARNLSRFLPLVQFKLSDIGEGIAEVQIKEWHVKEGDHVAQFDNICEVQSDKASVTITSRYDGIIKNCEYYDVEDVAKVGTTLVDIEVVGIVIDFYLFSYKQFYNSRDSLRRVQRKKQEENPNGKLGTETTTSENAQEDRKVLATPAVRQLAKGKGINLSEVVGTGISGRILKDDVIRYVELRTNSSTTAAIEEPIVDTTFHAARATSPEQLSQSFSLKKFEVLKEDKVVPIRSYTRAMVKSMSESLKIPHLGFCDEVNVDQLMTMREELKKFEAVYNARMSFMPIIIKAVSLALNKFPKLNAVIDKNIENIIYKTSHNISIAMDTTEGLVVPNIKHCEQCTIWEIAVELNRLQEASSRMKINPEDLKNGTFTLSNIGMIGGTYLSPVILPPQVAIGAIGQISKLPRFDKHGNVCAANVVNFSWAADHRVIDGATVAHFSSQVKQYLENPAYMPSTSYSIRKVQHDPDPYMNSLANGFLAVKGRSLCSTKSMDTYAEQITKQIRLAKLVYERVEEEYEGKIVALDSLGYVRILLGTISADESVYFVASSVLIIIDNVHQPSPTIENESAVLR